MQFNNGDRVEHVNRGKGTFLSYGEFENESIVKFDEDSNAEGDTLTVTTGLLKKLQEG
ncbi:hypothetical protein [Bacillus paralicheniformis]|uniref:hypothetical protein n=1 Tax=Bacillus paralicheniformis TaxID=1648923 RepID=UPI0015DEEC5E|nr:hypothetical protein [Bacillus paralicheniformis]